jgi:hypothetical protein
MSIEDLKKALDLSTFKFLDIFSAIYNQQKKRLEKTLIKWVYIICVRKTQNWRTVSFGVFQKHERTSSLYERTGKESTVRKAFYFNFHKNWEPKFYTKTVLFFFTPTG